MRRAVVLLALVGCGFSPGSAGTPGPIDAPRTDASGPGGDAAVDAAVVAPDAPIPPDASTLDPECPAAPAGCTAFGCAAVQDRCYYLCAGPRDMPGAQAVCSALMGDSAGCLLTLNSPAEQSCVIAQAAAVNGTDFYVGWVQDPNGQEDGGGWGWLCGSSSHSPGWGSGQPDNGSFPNQEDCAVLSVGGNLGDVGCDESFRFVCEVALD